MTKRQPSQPETDANAADGTEAGHPLFPLPEGADPDEQPPLIGSITLVRHEVTAHGAAPVWIPHRFHASELRELSQIQEQFGGGRYELIGRNLAGNHIVARRTYTLPGKPKPLTPQVDDEEKPRTAAAPAVAPALPAMLSQQNIGAWMQVATIVSPFILKWLESMANDRAAQARAHQELMLAIMNNQQNSAASSVAMMQSLLEKHSGGGGTADFMRGIEFMQGFFESKAAELEKANGGGEGGGANEMQMMQTVGNIIEGIKMIKELGGAGGVAKAAEVAAGVAT